MSEFTNRPVTMNEQKNLLEIEEHMYILDDVKKPNVFRKITDTATAGASLSLGPLHRIASSP